MALKLARSGIPGLDEILRGGIPRGINILIEGPPGSGKSILSWQFLYNGATQFNEPGIFVCVEERPKDVRETMYEVGLDIKAAEDENLITLIDASAPRVGVPSQEGYVEAKPKDIEISLSKIHDISIEMKAKRLVIDSISAISLHTTREDIDEMLYKLHIMLLELGCITFMVSQPPRGSYSFLLPIENIVQGIIDLGMVLRRQLVTRTIRIRKVRGINHRLGIFPFTIDERGVNICPEELFISVDENK